MTGAKIWGGNSILAVVGAALSGAEHTLGLVVLIISGVTGFVMLVNSLFTFIHGLHTARKDAVESLAAAKLENIAMSNQVCEDRRRTGTCPLAKEQWHTP